MSLKNPKLSEGLLLFVINDDPVDINFGKKSYERLDHNKDTLGIILSLISDLFDQ